MLIRVVFWRRFGQQDDAETRYRAPDVKADPNEKRANKWYHYFNRENT